MTFQRDEETGTERGVVLPSTVPKGRLANTLANKRIRVRKCGARLHIPADPRSGRGETMYTCQLEKHDIDTPHQEVGFVLMANNTARKFTIKWTDEGVATLREQVKKTLPRPKIRMAK